VLRRMSTGTLEAPADSLGDTFVAQQNATLARSARTRAGANRAADVAALLSV
jgi:hypothetical protein